MHDTGKSGVSLERTSTAVLRDRKRGLNSQDKALLESGKWSILQQNKWSKTI